MKKYRIRKVFSEIYRDYFYSPEVLRQYFVFGIKIYEHWQSITGFSYRYFSEAKEVIEFESNKDNNEDNKIVFVIEK